MDGKLLIVHADDFGLSLGISKGILDSIRYGIVTSTSVMVETPYLKDTVRLVKDNIGIDWGLHVVIQRRKRDTKEIINQTERQLKKFIDNFGILPSHFDYHQGFRFSPQIYFAARMFALKHKLAFRYDNKHKLISSFFGLKNNQLVNSVVKKENLLSILKNIGKGTTEIICHPGYTSNRLIDTYRLSRIVELKTLTNSEVMLALKKLNIKLIDYKKYATYANH